MFHLKKQKTKNHQQNPPVQYKVPYTSANRSVTGQDLLQVRYLFQDNKSSPSPTFLVSAQTAYSVLWKMVGISPQVNNFRCGILFFFFEGRKDNIKRIITDPVTSDRKGICFNCCQDYYCWILKHQTVPQPLRTVISNKLEWEHRAGFSNMEEYFLLFLQVEF